MTVELLSFTQELFVWMLVLSVQIIFILLVRKPLARYFGATMAYRLWLLPLLWLPLHWVDWTRFNWSLLERYWQGSADSQGQVSWFPLVSRSFDAVLEFPEQAFSFTGASTVSIWLTIALLWLGVAVLLMTTLLLKMRHFSRQLPGLSKTAAMAPGITLPDSPFGRTVSIRTIPGLGSPALYGVLRPQLLLPADFEQRYSPRQRALILAHEAVHYRRRDNLWNLLACTLRLLFWFNPLLHLAWRQFRLDQEMSCDEQALMKAGLHEGQQYARTLLEALVKNNDPEAVLSTTSLPTFNSWGRLSEIKERTHMIQFHLHRKPNATHGKLLLPLLAAVVFFITASLSGQLELAVAAEPPQETLSREVYTIIERVMEHRDAKQYTEAGLLLDDLESKAERGELNNREILVLWQFRANIAQIQEQYEDAITYYERILELPELSTEIKVQTLSQIGGLHYVQQDYTGAIDYYLQSLEFESEHQGDTHLLIAYAYTMLQQPDPAKSHVEIARSLGEPSLNTLKLLRQYQQAGNPDQATALNEVISAASSQQNLPLEEIERSKEEYLPTVVFPPRYPNRALQERIEGSTTVSFTVDENGSVVDTVIVESSPRGIFEAASLDAIARFKFAPKMENGVAISTPDVRYVFRFNLRDENE